MEIPFVKYHGAGNDFILLDQRERSYLSKADHEMVAALCDRHFGIGADGLMILQPHPDYDFEMVYFNADGYPGSMCGNGGRCIVAFAKKLGIIADETHFLAVDGSHEARISSDNWVSLRMGDVQGVEVGDDYFYLDTGSPHYIRFVSNLDEVDVVKEGRKIRYSERYKLAGTNVNFVEREGDGLRIVTYERGVEDETLACGTGVTAAALVSCIGLGLGEKSPGEVVVRAKGGRLSVQFERAGDRFTNIWLNGPAEFVFKGIISK